jgi:hypothetical protein
MSKIQPGQPFEPSASLHNMLVDMAADWKQRAGANGAAGRLGPGDPPVLVKNTTDEHRGVGEVLGIDAVWPSPGSSPAFLFGPKILHGVTPAAKHWGKYAILLEPIRAGKIGPACLSGCCPVRLILSDESATHCDIYPGDATGLRAGFVGTAEIIQKESGTGSVWAYVRLGVAPITHRSGALAGELKAGGKATVNLTGGGQEEATDVLLPPGTSLPSGTFVFIDFNRFTDPQRWEVTGAPGDKCEKCPDPCA